MKYIIKRDKDGEVEAWFDEGKVGLGDDFLHPVEHVIHHSPTGFEVGYGGSGPADLALSILCDALPDLGFGADYNITIFDGECDANAFALHQAFKWHFIAPMSRDGGEITMDQVFHWVDARKEKIAI